MDSDGGCSRVGGGGVCFFFLLVRWVYGDKIFRLFVVLMATS